VDYYCDRTRAEGRMEYHYFGRWIQHLFPVVILNELFSFSYRDRMKRNKGNSLFARMSTEFETLEGVVEADRTGELKGKIDRKNRDTFWLQKS
jgi:hypothetical protein